MQHKFKAKTLFRTKTAFIIMTTLICIFILFRKTSNSCLIKDYPYPYRFCFFFQKKKLHLLTLNACLYIFFNLCIQEFRTSNSPFMFAVLCAKDF